MTILTADILISAMQSAIQADAWLGDLSNIPTVRSGHSGVFDAEHLPCPCIVLAPERETPAFPPVSRNAQKLITITIHAYTEHYGEELGLIGDAYNIGVMPMINHIELLFDNNLLRDYLAAPFTTWVCRAHALEKSYPDPTTTNYFGLNEARLTVEYLTVNPALA